MEQRTYLAIDLKSFYASVECMERGLDPLTTNLVVADASRTDKTICLAVSPALKAYGIPGRARLFEVVQKVKEVNALRRSFAPKHEFVGSSTDANMLAKLPALAVDYVVAPPQMAHYMQCSTKIYNIYLKYISAEDIHIYSIDEVFMDVTNYLKTYGCTARELAMRIILDVLHTTGITATAGIGTNLYLCKIAMDIVAKHIEPDQDGVRIAELDELSYRKLLWSHRPLTDFWRIGRGYAKKLEAHGLFTMGDIARCSIGKPSDFYSENLLYRLFGVNAELLIDHAWGWESCTIADIKAYRPESNSLNSGQVLKEPYPYEKAKLVLREMAELLSLDLVEKGLTAGQIVVTVGYDVENLSDPKRAEAYRGEVTKDFYGRYVPKHAHGSANLQRPTASSRLITEAALEIFERTVDPKLLVRRLNISANQVLAEAQTEKQERYEQLDLFTDYAEKERQEEALEREKRRQKAMLHIKRRFGKNAILKGTDLCEGATTIERNGQIGGHKK